MNRRILKLAIPNVISNITVPMIGIIDTAIAGRLGDIGSIGAVALGATIFNFVYWNCAFLRMGTSGLTAQAFGARDLRECVNLLLRSTVIALSIALLMILLQHPIANIALKYIRSDSSVLEMVRIYFFARIWGAPATITLYSIHGWFIGMQNAKTPMWVSIFSNIVHVIFSLFFVYKLDMGIAGIAWGTVVSQYFGLLLSCILWWRGYRRFLKHVDWAEVFRIKPLLRFFDVNKDIFLRNVCNVFVYTFITYSSAAFGKTILDTNAILMQFFTLFSYMSDGFAYAAEALTGRFIGARNFASLRHAIRNMFWWCFLIAFIFVGIYWFFWDPILHIFTNSETIIASATNYIGWVMIIPLLGFAPFLMDGILIGATKSKILRNSMFLSAVLFFAMFYSLVGVMGNNALWLSFTCFLVSRGIWQYFMSDRMRVIYR